MQDFTGKTAVIAGAAGGIGLGLAQRFCHEGMAVMMADVDEADLERAAAPLLKAGASVLTCRTDVSDQESVLALAEATFSQFGAVHVLCANAGVSGPWLTPTWELPASEWERVFSVNVFGLVNCVQAFVPRMLADGHPGHVVLTASIASFQMAPYAGPYRASKHAALSIAETVRAELEQANSRLGVSVLCPDRVRTRILEREAERSAAGSLPGATFLSDDSIPVGGPVAALIEPADVANTVIDGIRSGRFYLFSHDDSAVRVIPRLDVLRDAVSS